MSELKFRFFVEVNCILDGFKMIQKKLDILISTFMDVTTKIVPISSSLALV